MTCPSAGSPPGQETTYPPRGDDYPANFAGDFVHGETTYPPRGDDYCYEQICIQDLGETTYPPRGDDYSLFQAFNARCFAKQLIPREGTTMEPQMTTML